jgi:ketosteroid isomerase-like protein
MRSARIVLGTAAIVALAAPLAGAQTRAAVAAAATAAREDAALRAAVEAGAIRASDAYNRDNMVEVVRDYADDVWVFPPNTEPYQGAQTLLDYHARNFRQNGFRNLRLTTTGFERSGHLAYETGTYTIDVPTGDRARTMETSYGKYMNIWKRDEGGNWRIHHVMWSSNLPPRPNLRPVPR